MIKSVIPRHAYEVAQRVVKALPKYHNLISDEPEFRKLACQLKLRPVAVTSGMYRVAMIMPKYVLKVSQSDPGALIDEMKFIEKMRKNKKFGRHFPETYIIKQRKSIVQLQERIPKVGIYSGRLGYMSGEVVDLGEYLGISDVHQKNYGWKGPRGKEWPVFIDVDFRYSGENFLDTEDYTRRSWMV